jgi:phage recombination protein Bet
MSEVAVTSAPTELSLNDDQLDLIKRTVLRPSKREATDDELALLAHQARRTGLDPLARQIYGIYRYDNRAGGEVMTIQTSIDGFRLTAQRSGRYLGQTPAYWCGPDLKWHEVWNQKGNPVAAKVGVYVKGAPEPTWAVAKFSGYADERSYIWKSMPDVMLAKCAEALALRKAFPAELSGLYTSDEMDQAGGETPAAPTQIEPPSKLDEFKTIAAEFEFDDETKRAIWDWVRADEHNLEVATEFLNDGNPGALIAGVEFNVKHEVVDAEVVE